ncbi:oligosaccharide flippase family protein [Paenibacillus oenotherae]|uniref:Oligosaccharide flippase family protein n=1 Tax=Paenibacillus oenotherae TaxID=1435645 RepID=A0ABS7D303_9BACL|nr:oligosaccharide flippase family protein [Paenibacillus oenotherae]MBW7474270.1 oligosaccharide flippase family protein [Paenibacillus oenotherae]
MANAERLAKPIAGKSAAITKVLARGGSISFLLNSTGMGLALIMQIVLARLLGAAAYGTYAFVTTVITFLVFPAKLGFDTSIVRLVAAMKAKDEWALIKGLLKRANQLGFAVSLSVTVIGFAILGLRYNEMTGSQLVTYSVGFATIPLLTLATLRQSALQALKDVLFAQMPEKIVRPLLTIGLLLIAVLLLGREADSGLAMICFAVAVAVSYMIGAFVLKKRIGDQIAGVETQYATRYWLKLSLSLMVNGGMYLILGQLSVLLLGMMNSETESGLFSAAVRLATLVSFAITAINMTAAPLLSESYARRDHNQLQQVCTTSGRAGFSFAAVVFIGFAVAGRPLLGLFGAEFTAAYPALLLLSAGQLFGAYCGQTGTMATMTGYHRVLTRVLVIATVLNVALSVALIPLLGMTGAAAASCCAAVTWNAVMAIAIKRKYGIITPVWSFGSRAKKGVPPQSGDSTE